LLIDQSWNLVRYRPHFVYIKRRTLTVDDASKHQCFFCTCATPHKFTSGNKTRYPRSFVCPHICSILYIVELFYTHYMHEICIAELSFGFNCFMINVTLIIKQLKPNEYESTQHI
jgi:hypothetical protein